MKENRNFIILLLLISSALFMVNLDVVFVNIMEARNFITAREMVVDGNWIFTTMNAEPRYEKPPLPTWLTAVSMFIFGMKSLFFLRLPAALMGVLIVIFSYKFLDKVTQNKFLSFVAGLITATSFYIIMSARDGQWDIFTHAFMLVSIYYFYMICTHSQKLWRYTILSALFFGFSFLSKGPVSLYALFLPFLLALGFTFGLKELKHKKKFLFVFVILSVLLSLSWNLYVYLFDNKVFVEVAQKETGNWTGYNTRPFYYYWSFVTQSGVWTLPAFVALLYPYLKNKVIYKKAYTFTLLWTIFSVVLLSLIPEKKSRYLLPVLIPMAMNTAFYFEYIFRSFKNSTKMREKWVVYAHFGILITIGVAYPFLIYFYPDNLFIRDTADLTWFVLSSLLLLTLSLLIFKSLKTKNIEKAFYLNIFFVLTLICFALPLLTNAFSANPDFKSTSQLRDFIEKSEEPLYEFESAAPEMIWEYGKPIPVLNRTIPTEERFYLLAEEENQTAVFNVFEKQFQISKITVYDMNQVPKGSKTHRNRLYRDLYYLERKNQQTE